MTTMTEWLRKIQAVIDRRSGPVGPYAAREAPHAG